MAGGDKGLEHSSGGCRFKSFLRQFGHIQFGDMGGEGVAAVNIHSNIRNLKTRDRILVPKDYLWFGFGLM